MGLAGIQMALMRLQLPKKRIHLPPPTHIPPHDWYLFAPEETIRVPSKLAKVQAVDPQSVHQHPPTNSPPRSHSPTPLANVTCKHRRSSVDGSLSEVISVSSIIGPVWRYPSRRAGTRREMLRVWHMANHPGPAARICREDTCDRHRLGCGLGPPESAYDDEDMRPSRPTPTRRTYGVPNVEEDRRDLVLGCTTSSIARQPRISRQSLSRQQPTDSIYGRSSPCDGLVTLRDSVASFVTPSLVEIGHTLPS
ncbi:unnamed protein product [Cyclocybe aegerita]|uniref:Uncharacterized protein n=1 Tax=Cyclocybe aegerita TaxID=1973307 RepID=A0A8S0W482_CYCAE|nr:unnamed protein product [Cyclocybe aegerita]